jgi:hypothetical protein
MVFCGTGIRACVDLGAKFSQLSVAWFSTAALSPQKKT